MYWQIIGRCYCIFPIIMTKKFIHVCHFKVFSCTNYNCILNVLCNGFLWNWITALVLSGMIIIILWPSSVCRGIGPFCKHLGGQWPLALLFLLHCMSFSYKCLTSTVMNSIAIVTDSEQNNFDTSNKCQKMSSKVHDEVS